MNIIGYLQNKYYSFKYRTKSGATSVVLIKSDGKRKNDFEEFCEGLANTLKPCEKTVDELIEYIKEKYGAQEEQMSDASFKMFKVNYILSCQSNLLTTPEIKPDINGKMPSRKEFLKQQENTAARFKEAMEYPADEIFEKAEKYVFSINLPSGICAEFHVNAERRTGFITAGASTDGGIASDEENKMIREILDDITLYRGVSQEDIEMRTPKFLGYAATIWQENK